MGAQPTVVQAMVVQMAAVAIVLVIAVIIGLTVRKTIEIEIENGVLMKLV